jgi:hypothetical protein
MVERDGGEKGGGGGVVQRGLVVESHGGESCWRVKSASVWQRMKQRARESTLCASCEDSGRGQGLYVEISTSRILPPAVPCSSSKHWPRREWCVKGGEGECRVGESLAAHACRNWLCAVGEEPAGDPGCSVNVSSRRTRIRADPVSVGCCGFDVLKSS